jgi:uncharacterized protein (TIGR02588 family)
MSKAHFPSGGSRQKRSKAEWISLAISAFIVLVLVSLVIFNRYNKGNRPAAIFARTLDSLYRQTDGMYYMPIEVRNTGSRTAEAVRVQGTVGAETRDFEIDFLDGEEKARGTLVFTRDPRAQLKLEIVSFREP